MRSVRALVLASAVVLSAAGGAALAVAQDDPVGDDHGRKPEREVNLSDLTPEQRAVTLDAWAHVYCACKDENWSRTLANCPDGCSRKQKQEIFFLVRDGQDMPTIIAAQVKKYGPRAAADPGASSNGSVPVVVGLALGAAAAGFVLLRWRSAAAERRAAAGATRAASPAASAEAAAVERELQEID